MPDAAPATLAPVSAVPHRMRLFCAIIAAVVVVGMVVAGALLPWTSTGVVHFHAVDQASVIVLGLILGAGILALGRPRIDTDDAGVRVRNILATHRLPWAAIRSVRFDRGSAWASLLLVTGEELSVLAIQEFDKEHAVVAVEGLRALLAAHRPPEPPRPPLLYED